MSTSENGNPPVPCSDRAMPPSLSALERGCPPSRRRSCLACTKSKRRCDNNLPACLRCSRRDILCAYPDKAPNQNISPAIRSDAAAATTMPSCDLNLDNANSLLFSTGTDPWNQLPPSSALIDFTLPSLTLTTITPLSDLPAFDATLPFQDNQLNQDASTWPNPDFPGSIGLLGCSDVIALPPVPVSALVSAPASAEDWNHVNRIITTHLRYAIDIIKDAPRQLVLENHLPWSHPLLYRDDMPRCMQDAFSSCALYLAKNSVNSTVILRSIDNRLLELLDTPEPTTPLGCIAHTHALLLYNIIGVFDGGINARVTIERTLIVLQESALKLLPYAKFEDIDNTPSHDALPLYPMAKTREFWDSWVLMESARRTFMIAHYFLQLYFVVMGIPPRACDERKYTRRYWTISAALWQARSAVAFALAWRESRYYLAQTSKLSELLEKGRAEDIDDFSRIFLSSMMGTDEFDGWMLTRSAVV